MPVARTCSLPSITWAGSSGMISAGYLYGTPIKERYKDKVKQDKSKMENSRGQRSEVRRQRSELFGG